MTLEIADPGTVVGAPAWSAGRCHSDGIMHGGAIMALADTVGSISAYLNLPEGATASAVESKTSFFRGALRIRTTNGEASTHRKIAPSSFKLTCPMSRIDRLPSSSRPRPCRHGPKLKPVVSWLLPFAPLSRQSGNPGPGDADPAGSTEAAVALLRGSTRAERASSN